MSIFHLNSLTSPSAVTKVGNITMLLAVMLSIPCIVVAYTHSHVFSILSVQIVSHISLILFATAFKIGYIMRCAGLKAAGKKF